MITLNHLIHDTNKSLFRIDLSLEKLINDSLLKRDDPRYIRIKEEMKNIHEMNDGFWTDHHKTLTKDFYIKLNQNNLEKQLHD